jgi:hypothetical protein
MALNTNIKIYQNFTLIEKFKWFEIDQYAELTLQKDTISKESFYIFKNQDITLLIYENWLEFEVPITINQRKMEQIFEYETFLKEKLYNGIMNNLKSIGVSELVFCKEELNFIISKTKNNKENQNVILENDCFKIDLESEVT